VKEPITSGEYAKLITATVRDIRKRGKEPIICGGSGLYYRAITKGIFKGSISNLKVREQLEKDYDEEGGIVLLGKLQSVDPDYAKIVHPNNRRRLVRALEIYKATGKPPSIHFKKQKRSEEKGLTKFTVFLTCFIDELEKEFEGKDVPLPENWGGYRLEHRSVEFWQGRRDRMHDRFIYTKNGTIWQIERLAP
jgi:tRNA dimethylallyltransferase